MCDLCFVHEDDNNSTNSSASGGIGRVHQELESQESQKAIANMSSNNNSSSSKFFVHDEVKAKNYTFSDVWNAIRTERNFKYSFWLEVTLSIIFNNVMSSLGNIFISIALIIIFFVSYGGFFYILPIVEPKPWSPTFILTATFGIFKMYSILFHYIAAVKTNPGYICPQIETITGTSIRDKERDKAKDSTILYDPTNRYPILENRCKKCDCVKPVRAHHCSTCKKCVLKMDHHCPWLGNCVGLRNYRYFLCFLFWVTITTIYVAVRSFALAWPTLSPMFTTVIYSRGDFSRYKLSAGGKTSRSLYQFNSTEREGRNVRMGRYNYSIGSPFIPKMIFNPSSSNIIKSDEINHLEIDDKEQQKLNEIDNSPVVDVKENELDPHDIFWLNRRLDSTSKNRKENSIDDQQRRKKADKIGLAELHDSIKSSQSIFDKIKIVFSAVLDIPPNFFYMKLGDQMVIVATFFLCCVLSVVVGGFFCYHLYLALTGQTTVEHSEGKSNRPKFRIDGKMMNNLFNMGFSINMKMIFGKYPWYIGILPFVYTPERSIPIELHDYLVGLQPETSSTES